MITIIALFSFVPALVLALILLIVWDLVDVGVNIIITITIIVFTCIFLLVIGICVCEKEQVLIEERELVSFNDGYSPSGSFFLGIGTISESPTIRFLIRVDNIIQLCSVQGNIYINEIQGSQATVRQYKTKVKNWLLNLFYIGDSNTYVFDIPEGTIKYNYSIDLQ